MQLRDTAEAQPTSLDQTTYTGGQGLVVNDLYGPSRPDFINDVSLVSFRILVRVRLSRRGQELVADDPVRPEIHDFDLQPISLCFAAFPASIGMAGPRRHPGSVRSIHLCQFAQLAQIEPALFA